MSNYRHKGTAIYTLLDGGKIQIGDKTIFTVARNKITSDGEVFYMKAATVKQLLSRSVELTHNSKLYPSIALPCTSNDVARLYTFYNKKLFNNECPPVNQVRITSISGTARKAYADATTKRVGDKITYRLRFSDKSMTTVEFFCNTVIHEMIHILHHKRFFADKMWEYEAANHGPLFIADMERINALGYRILKTVDTDNDVVGTLQEHKHVLVVSALDLEAAFYSNIPIDVNTILSKLRSSGFSPTSYYVGTSDDAKISTLATKLTAKNTFIGHVAKLPYKRPGFFKTFVTHGDVVQLSVPQTVQQAVYNHRKYLYWRWKDYLYSVENHGKVSFVLHPGDPIYDYIRTTWMSITDTDIKRSVVFKEFYDEILKLDLTDDEIVKQLAYIHSQNFAERVEAERYADVCVSKFDITTISGKELKKRLLDTIG